MKACSATPSVAPLAGDIPLSKSRYRLGTLAVIALVALRVGIGWHFFKEGTTKLQDPNWSAEGFLSSAKGPFRPLFALMIYDGDGKARLNYSVTKSGRPVIDLKQTLSVWDQFRVRAAKHYGFDQKQQDEAKKVAASWERQLKWYFGEHSEKIVEYFHGLERRAANERQAARKEVTSLRDQSEKIVRDMKSARAPWLKQVDALWRGFEAEMNGVATSEQAGRGRLAIGKPGRRFMDSTTIDGIIPYFDTLVGVLLLAGLFTRTASVAGALFLGSVVLTQWPGTPGAVPVYYQSIEALAMLVLAGTGAGRFSRLDLVTPSL